LISVFFVSKGNADPPAAVRNMLRPRAVLGGAVDWGSLYVLSLSSIIEENGNVSFSGYTGRGE